MQPQDLTLSRSHRSGAYRLTIREKAFAQFGVRLVNPIVRISLQLSGRGVRKLRRALSRWTSIAGYG